jgi:hypothetical protein
MLWQREVRFRVTQVPGQRHNADPSLVRRPDLVEEFERKLQELWLRAGQPSIKSFVTPLRTSRNTAAKIVKGQRLPTRPQLDALLQKLGVPESGLPQRLTVLWEQIHGLTPAAAPPTVPVPPGGADEAVPTTYYDSTTAFYSALEAEVVRARELVRVTYIRQSPPSRYANAAAASYFDRLIGWAAETELPVNRVIGAPVGTDGRPQPEFLEWLQEHERRTREVPTYESKVVRWSVSADAINMALIDYETAYLTFSGMNAQILRGVRVESRRFVDRLDEYFNQLWLPAVSLSTYLRDVAPR